MTSASKVGMAEVKERKASRQRASTKGKKSVSKRKRLCQRASIKEEKNVSKRKLLRRRKDKIIRQNAPVKDFASQKQHFALSGEV